MTGPSFRRIAYPITVCPNTKMIVGRPLRSYSSLQSAPRARKWWHDMDRFAHVVHLYSSKMWFKWVAQAMCLFKWAWCVRVHVQIGVHAVHVEEYQ